MVPNGWSLVKLGDVLTLGSGDTKPTDLQKEFSDDSPFPVYGGNNIMGYSSQKNSSDSVILIGRVGEYCGVTRYIDKACWITDNALYTKSVSSDIDKEYLVSKLKKFDLSRLRNKGGQPLVSQKPIYAVKLPMPPLPEQRKIAQILSTWDRGIATTEKLIETSKQQKKALMQQLLTGKKRLRSSPKDGAETGKAFEGEWEEVKLKSCVQFLNGQRKPIKQEERANIQGSYPYYGATGIIDYVNDYIFDDEIILLGEDGENILSRVLPHVFVVRGKVWVNNHAHVLKANKNADTDFLCMYLESLDYRKYNSGSAQPKINKAVCEKIPVRLPTLIEQQKIASVLTTADKEIEVLETKLTHFKQEKKALMQQLLTGKRRVHVE
ncbi:EcoKI restriction-modification system protein HsdS [Shewanella sp. P1-14-1]|uniref:restriction endonuclease subunit S n=1 Tax=Shewanella sp. P1-14-1 TaxID=1723761 RepID=UPI0006D654A8|nr:restriction endonuclease subunit S [Shewanella sp. P1-14-1]KPZ71259.1 EcoKI restriction-modification system protein HsdS [Shewanella sp. P1-14-1]